MINGKPSGTGFIEFNSEEECLKVLEEEIFIDGSKISLHRRGRHSFDGYQKAHTERQERIQKTTPKKPEDMNPEELQKELEKHAPDFQIDVKKYKRTWFEQTAVDIRSVAGMFMMFSVFALYLHNGSH